MGTTRFRVRGAKEEWDDKGPDLPRLPQSARRGLIALLGAQRSLYVRKSARDGGLQAWTGPHSTKDVVHLLEGWSAKDGDFFYVAKWPTHRLRAVVRCEDVHLIQTPGCSAGAVLARSLVTHRFPSARFGGGYVYKQTSYGYWSDHAWGDAVDMTENPPLQNEEIFDYVARMGQSGNMNYDYALGSGWGRVLKAAAPWFIPQASDASSSHLWHTHISVVDHGGAHP